MQLGSVGVLVIAQAPKMLPHIPQMRVFIAEDLGCHVDDVNVKATTTEARLHRPRGRDRLRSGCAAAQGRQMIACDQLTWLHGKPQSSGLLKANPEDFLVVEDLGFAPDGEGEHVLVRILKNGCNTRFVADALAKFLKIHAREVSFAGQKISTRSPSSGCAPGCPAKRCRT